jgi:hypothetical protein
MSGNETGINRRVTPPVLWPRRSGGAVRAQACQPTSVQISSKAGTAGSDGTSSEKLLVPTMLGITRLGWRSPR